jgi:hypothetical protein
MRWLVGVAKTLAENRFSRKIGARHMPGPTITLVAQAR